MDKKWCYYIPVDQFDENGYIPSMVIEDEPGHNPLSGDDTQDTWYWGKTYEEATKVCAHANEQNGVSPEEASRIVMSSLRAAIELKKQVRDSR